MYAILVCKHETRQGSLNKRHEKSVGLQANTNQTVVLKQSENELRSFNTWEAI